MIVSRILVALAFVLSLTGGAQSEDLATAIAAARVAVLPTLDPADARDVEAVYARTVRPAVWMDAAGRLTGHARAGLALVSHAATDGLEAADYGATDLAAFAAAIDSSATVAPAVAARFDVGLTASVLRYYRHLHLGRVDPRSLGLQIEVPDDGHDFAEALNRAIEAGRIAETAVQLSPPVGQYRALKDALARYRALAADAPTPPEFAVTVRPGDVFAGVDALKQLLVVLGDRPADGPIAFDGVYDEETRRAVERFQARHGLTVDGVIGRETAAALSVPIAQRVRQIELGLERLRWLPDLRRGRLVAVNIPMFRLWAWDNVPSASPPALSMSVIVGRALNSRTPVFAASLQYVVFRPYWNVPSSILKSEIRPEIRTDVEYLTRQNMEIVRGPADGSPVIEPTPEHIDELGAGQVRVRQRPGPKNALGLVKFMFPNRNDVYMHSTPATELFTRSRRDFSHGCIRVEDPVGLARWVLGRDPAWTTSDVEAAMHGADNRRVDLAEPVQVVIFYTTAVVEPADGAVHFAGDLYGQDAELDRALARRRR
jgi:murein L,D-transpeptidase YcbB/YkuD